MVPALVVMQDGEGYGRVVCRAGCVVDAGARSLPAGTDPGHAGVPFLGGEGTGPLSPIAGSTNGIRVSRGRGKK